MALLGEIILADLKTTVKYSSTKNYYLIGYFILVFLGCFNVFRTATFLGPFVDEIVSLTTSYSFFTSLNFDASNLDPVFEGNFKGSLSTGPFSALGSAVGWFVSKDLFVSRVSNFIWIHALQIFIAIYLSKLFELDRYLFLITSYLAILIQPWWFGTLYSLGETFSTLILFFGLTLFTKKRNLAFLIIGFAVWFGKDIHLLSFCGFYTYILFKERNLRQIFKDSINFLFPLFLWLILVYFKYDGTVAEWFVEFYNFKIVNNQSVSSVFDNKNLIDTILNNFKYSEINTWGIADFLRTLIFPLICIYLFLNKNLIKDYTLRNIVNPVFASSLPIFIWFWLLSSTKWIRYSQTFVLLLLLCLAFLISQKKDFQLTELAIFYFCFGLFISSSILFITYNIFFIGLFIRKSSKYFLGLIKIFMIFVFCLSLYSSYKEVNNKEIRYFQFEYCVNNLNSRDCFNEYMNS